MNANKHDNFLNGAVIAAGIVGLLLAVIDGPAPDGPSAAASQAVATAGIVLTERRA